MSGDGMERLAPTLEDYMRDELDKSYGWVALDALLFKAPKELRDESAAERIAWRWAETGKARLNAGGGKIRIIKVQGAESVPPPPPPPPPPPRDVRGVPPTPVASAPSFTELVARAKQATAAPKPSTPEQEAPMADRRSTEEIHRLITTALKAGPLKRSEICQKAGLSDSVFDRALDSLKGKVKRDGAGRATRYALANGAASSVPTPAATPTRKANGQGVQDLELKLKTLDGHIEAAKQSGRSISAFILGEIRADLERLAA